MSNITAKLHMMLDRAKRPMLWFFASFVIAVVAGVSLTHAAFNKQLNYQGKLTNASNVAVADGTYNMEFKLYTASTGGVAIWTETRTGADKVQVTSGLFSVLLGEVTSLAGVDFNQTLYLGVNIGGTGTPSWDGEMTPRKKLGAVPAAIEAENLGGAGASQYLRSDIAATSSVTDNTNAAFTIAQLGTGNVLDVLDGAAKVFTVLDGGNVGVGDDTPLALFTVGNGDMFQVDGSGNTTLQNQAELRLGDADGSNYIGLRAPTTIAANFVWTLPSSDSGGCLQSDGSGTISISSCGGAGSSALSAITAATGTNTINNGNYSQEWEWNTLGAATGFRLSSISTDAASNLQKLFEIALSGANTTAGQTTYGSYVTNTHTGTTSTNIAGYFSASGGTNNYGLVVESGNVGIGTTTPTDTVDIRGGINMTVGSVDAHIHADMDDPGNIFLSTISTTTAGDTNNEFQMDGTGTMEWGSGHAIHDVSLGRTGVGILEVGGSFIIDNNATISSLATGGTAPTTTGTTRMVVTDANGQLSFASNAVPTGTNTGDVTLAGENYLSLSGQVITANAIDLSGTNVTGTLAAARLGALTGDVTSAGGTYATTIASNAVTYAKLQQVAANSLVGNPTGALANASEITLGSGLSFSGGSLVAANIYNSDGTLTAARTLALGANDLSITTTSGSLYYFNTDEFFLRSGTNAGDHGYIDAYKDAGGATIYTEARHSGSGYSFLDISSRTSSYLDLYAQTEGATSSREIYITGNQLLISGITNLSTQSRLLGQASGDEVGYVTIGTGLSLASGVLATSNIPNSSLANSTIALSLGTTGTDANVSGSPASLGGTLTLNLPDASATNRGLLTAADWSTFNAKQNALSFGSTSQIPYVNATTDGFDYSGNLTFSGTQLAVNGGTVTGASNPVLDLSQTWNDAAVTFTGIKSNITSTAANASSLLLDLQVGGTSEFKVRKDGFVTIANGPAFGKTTGYTGMYFFYNGVASTFALNSLGSMLPTGAVYQWGNSANVNISTADTGLSRLTAGSVALGNGTNGDTSGTLSLSNINIGSLTSGRVPYATTGGQLIDSANLTFNGNNLTVGSHIYGGDGNATQPTYSFTSETGMGLYRAGAGIFGFSASGAARLYVSTAAIYPATSDGLALGNSTHLFSDLFLASGGVINWNNGDVTLTHSADALTLAGGAFVANADSLGTTQDAAKGISLTNTTAAAAGAQQISPAIVWTGQGWKTDATAASESVSFRSYVVPVQGTTDPTGYLSFGSSINGGAYNDGKLVLTSAGNVGIGTTSPANLLHVVPSTAGQGITVDETGGADVALKLSGYNTMGLIEAFNNGVKTFSLDASDSLYFTGGVVGFGTASPAYRLDVLTNTTGQTASNRVANISNNGATFDTTAGALTSYGGYFSSTSTRSAGANALTNVGLYATASGAQNNYAAIFNQGNVGIGTTTPGSLLAVDTSSSLHAVLGDINAAGFGDTLNIGEGQLVYGGGTYTSVLTATANGSVVIGDGGGDVNSTKISLYDMLGTISLNAVGGTSFTGGAVTIADLATGGTAPTTTGTTKMVITDSNGQLSFAPATVPTGTNTGDVTLTAVGSSPNANGASLSGQALTLQPADGSNPGALTAGTQTIGGVKTFSSRPVVAGILTNSTPEYGNLSVNSASSWTTTTSSYLTFEGATTVGYRILSRGVSSTSLASNQSYANVIWGEEAVTEGISGTHALLANTVFKPLAITGGAAAVANTATVYIEGAASATVTGNNNALWVKSGISTFGGNVIVNPLDTDNVAPTTTGTTKMVVTDANGQLSFADIPTGGSTTLDSILAATAANTINNAANSQEWQWNSLTTGTGMKLSSTSVSSGTLLDLTVNSTAAASDSQKALNISTSGANATVGMTTYGAYVSNSHTGTSSSNVAMYLSATGGTANRALVIPSGGGKVGIGTVSPTYLLDVAENSSGFAPAINVSNSDTGTTSYTQVAFSGTGRTWGAGVGNSTETLFGVANKYFVYDQTGNAMRFVIDTNGNVGIGDTSPAALFTVGNGDLFQVNSSGQVTAGSITSTFGSINIGANTFTTTGTVYGNTIDRSTAGVLAIGSIATSVNICATTACDTINIGTNADADSIVLGDTSYLDTTTLNGKLDAKFGLTAQTAAIKVGSFTNSGATFNTTSAAITEYTGYFSNSATRSTGSNALTNVGLYASAAGAQNNYAAIFDQGNVGIGTTTPISRFEVYSSTNSSDLLNVADSGAINTNANTYGVTIYGKNTYLSANYPILGVGDTSQATAYGIALEAKNGVYLIPTIQLGFSGSGGALDMWNYRSWQPDGSYGYQFTTKGSGAAASKRFSISGNAATANAVFENVNVGIGATSPGSPLEIGSTAPAGANASIVTVNGTLSDASNNQTGVSSKPVISPSAASTRTYSGLSFVPVSNSTNLTSGGVMGIFGGPYVYGTGTFGALYGGYLQNQADNTTTVTNSYGLYVADPYKAVGATISTNYGLYVESQTAGSSNFAIYSAGGTNYFAGNVGIGNSNPSYQLHVGDGSVSGVIARFQNSTGTCDINPTTTALSCSSDINLKKNITELDNADTPYSLKTGLTTQEDTILDKILAITPVTYNWNSENDNDPKHVGFIAQEVEQVFPDLVATDEQGRKSLNYIGLVPYTIKAVQEMNVRIAALPEFEDQTMAQKVADFLRGIAERGEAVISSIKTQHVHTEELCVGPDGDEVCVTKDQLQELLNNTSASAGGSPTSSDSTPSSDQGSDSGTTGDATGTDGTSTDTGSSDTDTTDTSSDTTDTGGTADTADTGTNDTPAADTSDTGTTTSDTSTTDATSADTSSAPSSDAPSSSDTPSI